MNATLILADSARTHPDGTFSMLRGGITQLNVSPNNPVFFRGTLLVRIVGTSSESGTHEFKIVCVNEDGAHVGPDFSGSFETPPQGGTVQLSIDMQFVFPRLGHYEFSLSVDRHQLGAWALDAVTTAVKKE